MTSWLTSDEVSALRELAKAISVPPSWLLALIDCESGWDHTQINKKTNAAGLNQIIPSTARALGLPEGTSLIARYPSRATQLRGPTRKYLLAVMGEGFKSLSDLALSNFWPAGRKHPEKILPEYAQKANLYKFKTAGDYGRWVEGRLGTLMQRFPKLVADLDAGYSYRKTNTPSSTVGKIVATGAAIAVGAAVAKKVVDDGV